MKTLTAFRGQTTLQDQINRLFNDAFERTTSQDSNLTTWAPAVDIHENEHELVVKADLPGVEAKDLDIRVENNILTIRGERRFEKKVNEDNYSARRARLWLVQPQLLAREHREPGRHQGRLPERCIDPQRSEARGSQAEADQGYGWNLDRHFDQRSSGRRCGNGWREVNLLLQRVEQIWKGPAEMSAPFLRCAHRI